MFLSRFTVDSFIIPQSFLKYLIWIFPKVWMDKSFRFSLVKVDATSKDVSIFLSEFSFTNIHDLQESG